MTGPGTWKNFTFTAAGTFSVTQMPGDIPGNLGKFLETSGNSGKAMEIPVIPGQELTAIITKYL